MNVSQALNWGQKTLSNNGIETPRLDALVLLEDHTELNRIKILAEPTTLITSYQLDSYKEAISKRSLHTPLAYIRGKSEFYGHSFSITNSVLVPRPESETMIELLSDIVSDNSCSVIDIGTGSGALIISAKLQNPSITAYATDISQEAIQLAVKNAHQHHVDVQFSTGDLIENVAEVINESDSIVLANLPYVPEGYAVSEAVRHEPSLAIYGGPDGLDFYRRLFAQLSTLTHTPISLLTESLPSQHQELEKIANDHRYKLVTTDDFIQLFNLEQHLA